MADEYDALTEEQLGALLEERAYKPPETEEEVAFIAWCQSIYRLGQQYERAKHPPLSAYPDEIRRNSDGTLDEIVAGNVHVHLEQMRDDMWWLGLSRGMNTLHVYLWRKKQHIIATVDDEIGFPDRVTDAPPCLAETRAPDSRVTSYCQLPQGHAGMCEA